MAGAFTQFRSFVKEKMSTPLMTVSNGPNKVSQPAANKKPGDESLEPHPSVGFKVMFNPGNGKLTVTVIGARHLPASVGNIPAVGYIVKVKLYPGKDKYETESRPESWPTYNTQFHFHIPPNKNHPNSKTTPPLETILTTSKFLTVTVFALDKSQKRKTVGSATWPLDHKIFTAKSYTQNNAIVETPEIWRRVTDYTGGLTTLTNGLGLQNKYILRAKDQLELSLCHVPGDIGEDDRLTLRVNRLRWSIDKTKEYQHKNAEMYVKLSVTNCFGQVMRCQKTLSFSPSISIHWPADDAKSFLEVTVPPVGPRNKGYICVVTLCALLGRGKKIHLGRVIIPQTPENPESDTDHWTNAMQKSGTAVTQWHNLLSDLPS